MQYTMHDDYTDDKANNLWLLCWREKSDMYVYIFSYDGSYLPADWLQCLCLCQLFMNCCQYLFSVGCTVQ